MNDKMFGDSDDDVQDRDSKSQSGVASELVTNRFVLAIRQFQHGVAAFE